MCALLKKPEISRLSVKTNFAQQNSKRQQIFSWTKTANLNAKMQCIVPLTQIMPFPIGFNGLLLRTFFFFNGLLLLLKNVFHIARRCWLIQFYPSIVAYFLSVVVCKYGNCIVVCYWSCWWGNSVVYMVGTINGLISLLQLLIDLVDFFFLAWLGYPFYKCSSLCFYLVDVDE